VTVFLASFNNFYFSSSTKRVLKITLQNYNLNLNLRLDGNLELKS